MRIGVGIIEAVEDQRDIAEICTQWPLRSEQERQSLILRHGHLVAQAKATAF